MKVEAYCACGGAIKGIVSGGDETRAQKAVEAFRQVHTMDGCKPCDSATARKTRRKMEKKA